MDETIYFEVVDGLWYAVVVENDLSESKPTSNIGLLAGALGVERTGEVYTHEQDA